MVYNIIVDAFLVIMVLLCAIIGYKVGFLKTIAKPVKLILAILIALYFARALGNALIYPMIYSPIENKLVSYLSEHHPGLSVENVSDLPIVIKLAASLSGVDLEVLLEGAEGANVIEKLVSGIAGPVVGIVSSAIAFVIIYIVSRIILSLLVFILGMIVERGVVGFFNGILGCVFAILLSAFIAWALVAASDFILHIPSVENTGFAREFTGGFIYKFLKNLNPIDLILSI